MAAISVFDVFQLTIWRALSRGETPEAPADQPRARTAYRHFIESDGNGRHDPFGFLLGTTGAVLGFLIDLEGGQL